MITWEEIRMEKTEKFRMLYTKTGNTLPQDEALLLILLFENLDAISPEKDYFNPLYKLANLPYVFGNSIHTEDLIRYIQCFVDNEIKTEGLTIMSFFYERLNTLRESFIADFLLMMLKGVRIQNVEDYIDFVSDSGIRSGRRLNEYYTPVNINRYMAKLLNVQEGDTIYDCCSGTGSSLLLAAKENTSIISQEINHKMVIQQELAFHLLTNIDYTIIAEDSLMFPECAQRQVDKVISNPPFALRGMRKVSDYVSDIPGEDSIRSSVSDLYFYNLITKAAKDRAVFLAPVGFLFKKDRQSTAFKRKLLECNYIEAIIQLPPRSLFGANIASAIVVIHKHKKDSQILMMNLEKSGCLKNNRLHIDIDEDKIPDLVEYVEKRHEKIEVSKVVNCDEIVKNEYNLIPDLYIEHIYEEEIVDLDALLKERKIIIEALQKQYTTVENLITQLKGDE